MDPQRLRHRRTAEDVEVARHVLLVRKHWNSTWGDRRQELVFVGGSEMDEQAIRDALDASLHGSAITGVSKAHAKLHDPFPAWGRAA
ncbi:hypothetical protein DNX69_11600 [Rhodopseudomonas palustris]|uniref:CobW C-terminal domain-containing protein n=1 Tax=Rhodopseudomonas palustris TaxID=1076 RepID=A0A323UI14_RHOPL|nr:hypothetical protein DNX69_11600 [Rhodopseudomonas palustris]